MELIDKDVVVAEIERLKTIYNDDENIHHIARYNILADILSFLNTLEVKEVDLENSMVCKVDWYDGFLLDYTQEQQDELLEKIGADVGDKIRVILIKE